MKLLTILFSVLLLAPAWAQARGDGGDGPFGGGQAGPRDTGLRSLVQFLELDESQVEALLMMQSANAQALGLLARSIGENQRELQRALLADSPEEATVGRLLLAGRAIQREINLLRQSQLEAAPDALNLSSEQRDKLELLQASLRLAPIAQMAAGLNLVRGPALFSQGGALPPAPIPTVGAILGRNRDGGGDLEMRGLTPGELEMTLESLQSEVDRIGQNVDRVSQRLSVPPIPKEQ